ncbi:TraU family protein [Legionella pneumophila]|nr:TraU family protein [Legionella pneumophila]
MFIPLSIGNAKVVNSSLPDTENASSPIGVCPASTGVRLGLNIGFWSRWRLPMSRIHLIVW